MVTSLTKPISPAVLLIMIFVLTMVIVIDCATSSGNTKPPPPITNTALKKIAASLEMYVDQLPQIPKLLGYSTRANYGRSIEPGRLTIGMFQTKWVRLL